MLARSRSRFRGRVQAASFLAEMARYGATDVWDFTAQQYIRGGIVGASGITFTRASAGYAQRVDGRWELFGSGAPRITDRGLLVEGSRINRALFSRDLTNAAWTATNITVARNQVGIDGTANAACSLTATAGNGTLIQAVTHASTARFFSIWVRRLTGTGTVQVTLDNGTTWTTVTVTEGWTRVGAAQTLANPTVGVRLVTSGDAIAVDFAQLEDGGFPTSPIATEGTAVTRASDAARASITSTNYPITLYVEALVPVATGLAINWVSTAAELASNADRLTLFLDGSTNPQADVIASSSSQAAVRPAAAGTAGLVHKFATRANTNNVRAAFNTTLSALDSLATMPAAATFVYFGQRPSGDLFAFSYLRRIALIPSALTDAQLQAITT